MSIDAVGDDFPNVFSLSEWLESNEAAELQRELEERIMNMLFSHDPSSPAFQQMAFQLAWIGSSPAQKSLLKKEIIALDAASAKQCDFWKNLRRKSCKVAGFVADHAVEIAVGAAIVATGVGIAIATGYTLSVAVAGVAVAGAGSILTSEEKPNPRIPSIPLPDPHACSKEELAIFQQPLPSSLPKIELPHSANELLVTSNGVWVQGQYFPTEQLINQSSFSPVLTQNIQSNNPFADWKTFVLYSYFSEQLSQITPSYQARGQTALALGEFSQALQNFEKAIEANPTQPATYLERGIAHFGLGQYESALEDFSTFAIEAQTTPLSITEFSLGFATGLPQGTYESGKGMALFLLDFVKHPIATSKQVVDSITTLVALLGKEEWGMIAESLSPEIVKLVTQWDSIPSFQRGELAGYAIGKLGTDILAPGGLAKIASKSVKSAQELIAVCKNLKIAEEILILEAAAEIGDAVKIAAIIETSEKTISLAEELGITAKEMGQLKQARKLDETLANNLERITNNPALHESYELFERAQEFLEPHTKLYMTETKCRDLIHQTGILTFPRPTGIPENFRVRISGKGAGLLYVHPDHTHTYIRVMPGKPHSPYPHQQKPYVICVKDSQFLDKFGNVINEPVPSKSPQAHIPIDEFMYNGK